MVIVLISILALLAPPCVAQEKAGVGDAIIGAAFKTLARAFIVTVDIDTFKKNNSAKVNKLSEEKFKARYDKVYAVIKDLPVALRNKYGVTEAMTKQQAIAHIKALDKNTLYEVIGAIPDSVIAAQFARYLAEKKQEMQESNVITQITNAWNKMIAKAVKPTAQ